MIRKRTMIEYIYLGKMSLFSSKTTIKILSHSDQDFFLYAGKMHSVVEKCVVSRKNVSN